MFVGIRKRFNEISLCFGWKGGREFFGEGTYVSEHQPVHTTVSFDVLLNKHSDCKACFQTINHPSHDLIFVHIQDTIYPADLKFSNEQLGGGGQGMVWKGMWKGMEVAIKKCLRPDPKDMEIFQQLDSHPNIVEFYGVVVDMQSKSCSIVTELVKGGSLYNFLHKEKKTPSDTQKSSWMKGVAEGMQFLHGKGLAHRDLKSGNVLLAGDNLMTAKLCDFGSARELDHTTAQTAMTGTYRWMAPEVIRDDNAQINQKCDVFSYGMVLFELVTQKLPFEGMNDKLAMMELYNQKRPALPPSDAECPPYLRCLIIACWAEEPHERPSFQEVCEVLDKKDFS